MNKFFRLHGAYKRSAIIVDTNIDYDEDKAISDISILSDRKMKFKVFKGKKLFDIIQLRYDGFNFLISSHFKDVLKKNSISGWKTHQINIDGIKEKYYVFHIYGKAGKILNLEEQISISPPPIEFDINTWDRSDIFMLKDTATILCTEKVKEILEKAEITNLEIEPL